MERLVEAFYQLEECEPREERRLLATYRRLFHEAAARLPSGYPLEDLQAAIRARARQMKAARKKPPTLPPQA